MLNLCGESQGCIYSFKLSRENIKHVFTDDVYHLIFNAKG